MQNRRARGGRKEDPSDHLARGDREALLPGGHRRGLARGDREALLPGGHRWGLARGDREALLAGGDRRGLARGDREALLAGGDRRGLARRALLTLPHGYRRRRDGLGLHFLVVLAGQTAECVPLLLGQLDRHALGLRHWPLPPALAGFLFPLALVQGRCQS